MSRQNKKHIKNKEHQQKCSSSVRRFASLEVLDALHVDLLFAVERVCLPYKGRQLSEQEPTTGTGEFVVVRDGNRFAIVVDHTNLNKKKKKKKKKTIPVYLPFIQKQNLETKQ
jgi:hypothetical protein